MTGELHAELGSMASAARMNRRGMPLSPLELAVLAPAAARSPESAGSPDSRPKERNE